MQHTHTLASPPPAGQFGRRKDGLSDALNAGLADFDRLPASALVPLSVVMGLTGRKRTSIYALIKTGGFPAPVKLSEGCSRWRVGDLRKAIGLDAQVAA